MPESSIKAMMTLIRLLVALAAIAGVLTACGDPDAQRSATTTPPPDYTRLCLSGTPCPTGEPEPGTPVSSPTAYVAPTATPEQPIALTTTPPTSTPATTSGETGVAGTVLIGPQCPVVREDEPCPDKPYEADIDVYDASERLVARVRSNANGEFFVALAPGAYGLEPRSPGALPYGSPQDVTVIAGQVTEVVVQYDSGIR